MRSTDKSHTDWCCKQNGKHASYQSFCCCGTRNSSALPQYLAL